MQYKTPIKRLLSVILPAIAVETLIVARHHLRNERKRRRICYANNRLISKLSAKAEPIKLELGAGDRPGANGWTTVDLGESADLTIELGGQIPFPDRFVDVIYSSHLLEHLAYPQPLTTQLNECHRILKPGGLMSVAVPNSRIYLNAYFDPNNFNQSKFCTYDTGLSFKSKIDYVNYMAYMGGHHRHMFDEENLLRILSEAGFRDVSLRDFDPELDLESRRHETIYAIGEK